LFPESNQNGYRKNPSTQKGSAFHNNSGAGVRGHNDTGSAARYFKQIEPDAEHTKGRFPANLILDGSDEVKALFPETGGEKRTKIIAKNGKGTKGIYGDYGENKHDTPAYPDSGSVARYFKRIAYYPKASRKDRNEWLDGFEEKHVERIGQLPDGFVSSYGNVRNKPKPIANSHPTVKNTNLMRYLCRLITPPDGIVLDMFMGSGSTGKACMLEGFRFIGIEQEKEYFEIAKARIEHEVNKDKLFKGIN
jgi:site-specific DNA-methyltransferase (adenine-specific)